MKKKINLESCYSLDEHLNYQHEIKTGDSSKRNEL
jgi:hypothetical protein